MGMPSAALHNESYEEKLVSLGAIMVEIWGSAPQTSLHCGLAVPLEPRSGTWSSNTMHDFIPSAPGGDVDWM